MSFYDESIGLLMLFIGIGLFLVLIISFVYVLTNLFKSVKNKKSKEFKKYKSNNIFLLIIYSFIVFYVTWMIIAMSIFSDREIPIFIKPVPLIVGILFFIISLIIKKKSADSK